MAISETKMQMVIANYFKDECDVNTSIRQAFEKGFRIGVKKGASTNRPQGKWLLSDIQSQADNDNGNYAYVCTNCNHTDVHAKTQKVPYCWWCGARMKGADDYERAIEQMEHDMLYEPTYNSEDGSM